jgi:GTPase SAR1 family protein
MQQAKTLNEIIALKNNTDLTSETVNMFYVMSPGKIEQNIDRFFQIMHHHPKKMLFIGPKGVGKRSLLRYLSKNQLNHFHCLSINLQNILNPFDISQIDIVFCLLNHLIHDLSNTQKRIDPGVLNNIYQSLHDEHLISLIHFKKSEAGDDEGTKIGFVKSFINAIVDAISTAGNEIRNHIRKSFEPRLRLILKSVQNFIDYSNQLYQRNGKCLLIIFDDLGHFDQFSTEIFFQNHLSLTKRLHTHIIYTMPDFFRFSPFFQTVCDQMDRIAYLRMSPVVCQDQSHVAPGKKFIDDMINKRIDSRLIPDRIREAIIMASGGVISDAYHLLIETAIGTVIDNAETESLQQYIFEQVKAQLVRQKIQQLNYQQFCLLKELDLLNPSWTDNKDIQRLIKNNVIIEYASDQHVWFDIHPLIKEYFQTGRK